MMYLKFNDLSTDSSYKNVKVLVFTEDSTIVIISGMLLTTAFKDHSLQQTLFNCRDACLCIAACFISYINNFVILCFTNGQL